MREEVNYPMGSRPWLPEALEDAEPELLSCLNEAISFFKEVCKDKLSSIRAIIGDGIGEDWMHSYLSGNEIRDVVDFLLEHDLTT